MEYASKQQQSGIRYVLILVTLHPNAAKLLDIVFEYRVKHCPFAHRVVVVYVSALKIVVKPVAPKKPSAPY